VLYRSTLATLLASVMLLAGSIALAQSARSLALAGTSLPGHDASSANPATLALADRGRTFEIALPLGALNYLLQDWADPLGDEADYLALAAQLAQLDTLLLLVPRSPDTLTVRIDADGVALEGDGAALRFPDRFAVAERLELPLRLSVAPALEVGIRPYANLRAVATLVSSLELEDDAAVAASADATVVAEADAGIALELAYGLALPNAAEAGISDAAVGARAHLLVGLAYAAVDAQGALALQLNSDGLSDDSSLAYGADLDLGGLLGGGVGFGAAVDVGLLATLDSPLGPVAVELLVERLGVMWWTVERISLEGDLDDSSETDPVALRQLRPTPFDVSLAAGLRLTPATFSALGLTAELPDGLDPVIAVNLGYGLASGVRGSLATEVGLDALRLRAGAGYDAGWRFGTGIGYDIGAVGLDVALAARQTPLTGAFSLGVAASLRVSMGR